MKRFIDRCAWCAVVVLENLMGLLPVPAVWRLGDFLGRIAHAVLPGYRELARANHRIAFAGEMSEPEIRASVARAFRSLGGNLLAGLRLSRCDLPELADRLQIDGLDDFRSPSLAGRGNIVALLHMGGWETTAQAAPLYLLPGHRLATIYQPLGNPLLDARVRAAREKRGIEAIARSDGFREAIRILRSGGVVGVLIDQHAGDAGIWTPFFGRLASTTTLPALLAARTGAALTLGTAASDGPGRWRLRFRTACDRPEGRGIEELTALLNRAAEAEIRRAPHEWFWVHRRWKTPSPKFLLKTYKRGVAAGHPGDLKPFRIVVRSPNWLGDAVMAAPAVRAIKHGRPDVHLTVLTPAKLADLWSAVPEVDAVLPIAAGETVFSVARRLRSGFDAAVVLPNSVRSALEPWLAGIPRRVGYAGRWRSRLLDQIVPADRPPGPPRHQVHHYLDLAERIGADLADPTLALPPAGFAGDGPVRIGLCPGAEYGPAKRWLPERYAEVMQRLSSARGCTWSVFGTARDTPIAAEILGRSGVSAEDRTGKTTLAELMQELRRCRVLVTNDTGTMHLAALLGVPVVAIFGSTEPALTGPLGSGHVVLRRRVECSPCFLRDCPLDFRCMKAIGVDEVVAAVERILDASPIEGVRVA